MQDEQTLAATGISLRQCGHARVAGSSCFRRAVSAFTGFTTTKKTAAAMITNEMSALRKAP